MGILKHTHLLTHFPVGYEESLDWSQPHPSLFPGGGGGRTLAGENPMGILPVPAPEPQGAGPCCVLTASRMHDFF